MKERLDNYISCSILCLLFQYTLIYLLLVQPEYRFTRNNTPREV